jgi:glucokinase
VEYALAVDLGGTKVETALVDADGILLTGSRFRAPTGRDNPSDDIAAGIRGIVRDAVAALPEDGTLIGAGIGSAGPITVAPGLVSPLNLPQWRDFPLRDLVASALPHDLPVSLRKDGECITIAEHWVGAGRGVDDMMGMVVSTGVGGGLILGGIAVAGPTGNAGEIGHIEVGGFDDLCDCGGVGCLEGVASGPKTVAWARRQGWTGTTGEELAASYAAADPIARAAVRRSGRALGQALASATAFTDLSLVAVGGGFSKVTPDLLDFAREAVAERREYRYVTALRIVPSGLSNDGPLIGAAALIHRAHFVA